jgi:hypothetical protein
VVALLGGVLGSLLLGGTYALATNVDFVLGSTANQPDALTAVVAKNVDGHGGLNGPMIRLTNNSTSPSATALALGTNPNRTPFTVNSGVKVTHLNADRLDNIDSTGFVQGGGRLTHARAFFTANTFGNELLDNSAQVPPFSVTYDCDTNDPSFWVTNRSPSQYARVIVAEADGGHVFRSLGLAPGQAIGDHHTTYADELTYHVSWSDGHTATIWASGYTLDNQPDVRDDGCYVQVMALSQ